jgi:hypothetical protein
MFSQMTVRERFLAIMNFQPFDRLPILEWAGWWDKTVDRWHSEGLPESLTDVNDIRRYFGQDIYLQYWIASRRADCPHAPSHGAGIIANEADYERIRRQLYPLDTMDLDAWRQWSVLQQRGENVLWFTLDGFFWFARELLGIERHLYAFYEQPELMHRINTDLSEWMLRIIDQICEICTPDFMTFAEDMSYNNGPMVSREIFNEFMKPYYAIVVPRLKERGIIPVIDSDGDIAQALPWFEDAGLQGILPLERQSGVDVAALRRNHPAMRFIGHFDKMVMSKGESAMRAEFERLVPVARQGGFLISCDHQTPPGVSLADYRMYMRLFGEYSRAS